MTDSINLSFKSTKSSMNGLNDCSEQTYMVSERTFNRLESEESLGIISDLLIDDEALDVKSTSDFYLICDKYGSKKVSQSDTVILSDDDDASIVDNICLTSQKIVNSSKEPTIIEYSSTPKQFHKTFIQNLKLTPFVLGEDEKEDSVIIEPSLAKCEVDNIAAGEFSPILASTAKILPFTSSEELSRTFRSYKYNIPEILSPIREENTLNATRVLSSNCDTKESDLTYSFKNELSLDKTFKIKYSLDGIPSQTANFNEFSSSKNLNVALDDINGETENLNGTFVVPVTNKNVSELENTFTIPLCEISSNKMIKMRSSHFESRTSIRKDLNIAEMDEINDATSLKSSDMKIESLSKVQHCSLDNVPFLKSSIARSMDIQTTNASLDNVSKIGSLKSKLCLGKTFESRMSLPLTKQKLDIINAKYESKSALEGTFCVKEKAKIMTLSESPPETSTRKSCVDKSVTHLKIQKPLSLNNGGSKCAFKQFNKRFSLEPKGLKNQNLNSGATVSKLFKPKLNSSSSSNSDKTAVKKISSNFTKNVCNENITKETNQSACIQTTATKKICAPFSNKTNVATQEFIKKRNSIKMESKKSCFNIDSSKPSNEVSNHSSPLYSKPLKREIKLNVCGSNVPKKTFNNTGLTLPKAIVKPLSFESKGAQNFDKKIGKNFVRDNVAVKKETLKVVQEAFNKVGSENSTKKSFNSCNEQSELSKNSKKSIFSTIPRSSISNSRRSTIANGSLINLREKNIPETRVPRISIANMPTKDKFTNGPTNEVKEISGIQTLKRKPPVSKLKRPSSFKRNDLMHEFM